jgi:hypothetical protein
VAGASGTQQFVASFAVLPFYLLLPVTMGQKVFVDGDILKRHLSESVVMSEFSINRKRVTAEFILSVVPLHFYQA